MTATVRSAAVVGVEAVPIWIEVDVARGLPQFNIVGLPDSGVRESRERVRSALRNAGFSFPVARITVNLAPSDLRKVGASFDLPIALGILIAQGLIPQRAVDSWVILGELALDGRVRPVRGALCTAVLLTELHGSSRLMLPKENAHEVALLPIVDTTAVSSLKEAVTVLSRATPTVARSTVEPRPTLSIPDRDEGPEIPDPVLGQEGAKRALEIALAGGHNALMIGPPGSGKTLLGERIPYLLPPLSETEALEVNRIYSAAGLLDSPAAVHKYPPIRMPHHTITTRALIGGGNPVSFGELSLAHRGVLFLDEIPLFRRTALEALREPLEQGVVRLNKDGVTTFLPGRTLLIAAMNPCPCGWLGDAHNRCMCSHSEIIRYRRRLSGPLLDRIDIVVQVARTPLDARADEALVSAEPLSTVRSRIIKARQVQRERNDEGELNGHIRGDLAAALAVLPPVQQQLLVRLAARLQLTGRGIHSILQVARSIADLEGSEAIETVHIAEAAAYRVPPGYFNEGGAW